MMMKTVPAFWKALDEIPGIATDARDWRCRLGDEFEHVSRFLRRTGRLALGVDCPSPGGDGCPRRVIKRPGGGWRAVCGSLDSRCDALDLSVDDIAILEVDRAILAANLVGAFAFTRSSTATGLGRILSLGEYAITAGASSSAFLLLPGQQDPLGPDHLRAAGVPANNAIILVPSRDSLLQVQRISFGGAGHYIIYLNEIIAVFPSGKIGLMQSVEQVLHPVRERLLVRHDTVSAHPVVLLAGGTTWEQITLTFTSRETLICAAPGVTRQMDPSAFGMRSKKNHTVTYAWTTLRGIAIANGRMASQDATRAGKIQKQKQELSKRLKATFGLIDEPIPWSKRENAYIPRFVLRDDRPMAEKRQDAARRNFAG